MRNLQKPNGLHEDGPLHEGWKVVPLTAKGKKTLAQLQDEYGKKRGEGVFYAMINSGKLKGAEQNKRKKRKA